MWVVQGRSDAIMCDIVLSASHSPVFTHTQTYETFEGVYLCMCLFDMTPWVMYEYTKGHIRTGGVYLCTCWYYSHVMLMMCIHACACKTWRFESCMSVAHDAYALEVCIHVPADITLLICDVQYVYLCMRAYMTWRVESCVSLPHDAYAPEVCIYVPADMTLLTRDVEYMYLCMRLYVTFIYVRIRYNSYVVLQVCIYVCTLVTHLCASMTWLKRGVEGLYLCIRLYDKPYSLVCLRHMTRFSPRQINIEASEDEQQNALI